MAVRMKMMVMARREQDLFECTIFSQECNLTEDEQA
jgi:hypothetical protein